MIVELRRIENATLEEFTEIIKDQECEEYFGYNFKIGQLKIKFRKAKITPKKVGQFVTLWKRNFDGQTEPFNVNEDFDFYIVATEQDDKFGFFLFSKYILSEKLILTNKSKEGKRGFRVYPAWDTPKNKQAEKTKQWQEKYFLDLTKNKNAEKFSMIINNRHYS
jgi:hypothetical protein